MPLSQLAIPSRDPLTFNGLDVFGHSWATDPLTGQTIGALALNDNEGFVYLFASAMGIGVAFSAVSVLAYQGLLTLVSIWLKPYVTPLMLAELTGIGGAFVLMIGLGLLDIKKLKTGDFLPALVFTVLFVIAMPYVTFL